ncbi:MAG: protein TolQ [Alphaproteobacteria bacterium]
MEPHTMPDVAFAAASADFSMISLFMKADVVVKAVMAGLALASVWSWAIIFNKGFTLGGLKGRATRFEDLFWSGRPLDELYKRVEAKPDHPLAVVFVAAMREWRRSLEKRADLSNGGGLVNRINTVMQATIAREVSGLQKNMNFLATLASSGTFIGLFGTVWGIMNAFERIGVTQSTSLAVVAPAIAEALMATGVGLAAAIPALIFYNRYSNTINEYAIRLDGFADEFSAILSRQVEERSR